MTDLDIQEAGGTPGFSMHAICHRKDGLPDNMRSLEPKKGLYVSGWWALDAEQIALLPGGWLYLHEASGRKSHFCGQIEAIGDANTDGRFELTVRKQAGIGDHAWRGKRPGQNPRDYFRLVPADLPHETKAA